LFYIEAGASRMARDYIWKYLLEQKYYKIRTFCTKVHGVVSLVSGAKNYF
jgi:hypothetical protein